MTLEPTILHFTIALLAMLENLLSSLLGSTGAAFAHRAEDVAGSVFIAAHLSGKALPQVSESWFPGLGIGGASFAVTMAPWRINDLRALLPGVPADALRHVLALLFTAAAVAVTIMIFAMPPIALA